MSAIDLHVHTTISDGTLPPEETVREAARLGVRVLGITDHDITDGVVMAQPIGKQLGVEIVPGVEIAADYEEGEAHILGYFIDVEDEKLQTELARFREGRVERNRKILDRLNKLGYYIDPERVAELAGVGSMGRPHIAAALIEAGYFPSQAQVFHQLLAWGRPAFVQRYQITPAQAISMIAQAGGIPVLAHPANTKNSLLIRQLVGAGLRGIEVYYWNHSTADTEHYLRLADQLGLLVTGGTDCHGPRSERPGLIGSVPVPEEAWERLKAASRLGENIVRGEG